MGSHTKFWTKVQILAMGETVALVSLIYNIFEAFGPSIYTLFLAIIPGHGIHRMYSVITVARYAMHNPQEDKKCLQLAKRALYK